MGCIEELSYTVLEKGLSFPESRKSIEKRCSEIYHIMPGTKLFGDPLIGPPPISIGLIGDVIVFPYVKPCHGTFLLSIEDPAEAARLRSTAKRAPKK